MRKHKTNQKGISLIEVAAVLVIASLITGSALVMYSGTSDAANIDDLANEIQIVRTSADDLLRAKGDAIGLSTAELATGQRIPARWTSGTELNNAFKGNVTVTPYTVYSYALSSSGMPPSACIRLVTMDFTPGPVLISTHNGNQPVRNGNPLTPVQAEAACMPARQDGTTEVTWVFGEITGRLSGGISLVNSIDPTTIPGRHIEGSASSGTSKNPASIGTTKAIGSVPPPGVVIPSTPSTPPSSGGTTGGSTGGTTTPPPSTTGGSTGSTSTPSSGSSGSSGGSTGTTGGTGASSGGTGSTSTSGGNSGTGGSSTAPVVPVVTSGVYSASSPATSQALWGTSPGQNTWDPGALGLGSVSDGSFIFNAIQEINTDAINIAANKSFVSNGYIQFTKFLNGSADVTPTGLANSQWSLVMAYTGAGTASALPSATTAVNLTYSSLNYVLYLDPNGTPGYSSPSTGSASASLPGNSVVLGTGSFSRASTKITGNSGSTGYEEDTIMQGGFSPTNQAASSGFFGLSPSLSMFFGAAFSDLPQTSSSSGSAISWLNTSGLNSGKSTLQ